MSSVKGQIWGQWPWLILSLCGLRWVSYLSVSLHVLVCTMDTVMVLTSEVCCKNGRVSDVIYLEPPKPWGAGHMF